MNYNKLNNLTGWLVFLIATIVYFLTIEDTVSLWDCGEYITAANKLEVGHPPGAPLFMLLGRLFSFFAEPEMVAVWINRLSALCSSFTILFLYWSITMFAKKIMQRKDRDWSRGDQIATLGAGIIGALAYTFSDSFWFSAVEGEVYAMSSLFTAAIFWMILKWDAEMIGIKHGEIKDSRSPMRWMILIWFMFGLAIGVHLLGLLAVPAIAYVIYFNLWEKTNLKGIILTGLISVVVLGFVQEGIIPGTVALASWFEVSFVNSFGLPFFTGTIFFFLLLIAGFLWAFKYAKRKMKPLMNTAVWSLLFLLIGYGSFAVIVIRSNANTPLDENDPENLVTLHAYLKREQYGSWPILNGQYWNSELADPSTFGDGSPYFLRRFVITNNSTGLEAKAFLTEKEANEWVTAKGGGFSVKEKYFSSNETTRKNNKQVYAQTTFLPRMHYTSNDPRDPKIAAYKNWSGYDATDVTDADELGADGLRLPRFGENMQYMFRYQMNWMYWRYFMWNFAGRQNDFQGHGDAMRGNWISGFSYIDDARLGSQENAPYYTLENPAHNNFWLLPLILGVIGVIFHFYRAPKDAFIVFLTFFFTGVAIVIYLNQKPYEPRERDYAYAASFYAFAFWIGLSVLALYDAYKNFSKVDWKNMLIGFGGLTVFILFFAIPGGFHIFATWITIAAIALALLGIAYGLRKVLPNNNVGAIAFTVLTLFVPYIMGSQGWDDHDRSEKTSAHDLAYNYLKSCEKNGIIFSVGDNDTFPLWYLQEVEGVSTDVRVCNTSLFDTDWYTNQMKMKMYDSEPLPITFREDQILQWAGGTDQAFFQSTTQLLSQGIKRETVERIFKMKRERSPREFNQAYASFAATASGVLNAVTSKDPSYEPRISEIRAAFTTSADSATLTTLEGMQNGILEIFEAYRNQMIETDVKGLEQLQTLMSSWEDSWSFLPIKEVISFMKDDENIVKYGTASLRVIPCTGFILPVNKKNAIASKIITAEEANECEDEIRFRFNARSVQAITKSDIMILDMLANNDWKRPMYFTSPGNTEVSTAMYQSGHLRTNGMAWEISPITAKGSTPINEKLMYKHLMETYHFGKMNDPNVLTDYYARRQTVQFRTMFAQLAEHYVIQAEQMETSKQQYGPMIKNLRASGQNNVADSLENTFDSALGMSAVELRKRASKLIHKSLEVMPANVVLDYGERPSSAGPITDANGNEYTQFQDGVLQDYVGLLYRANDKEGAEKLGAEVARQIESILGYFKNSPAKYAANNYPDYIAAVGNYATIHKFAGDPRIGNPNGVLFARTSKGIEGLYNVDLKRIYTELDQLSLEDDEMDYSLEKQRLQGTMNAIDFSYQLTGTQMPSAPANPASPGMPAGSEMMLPEEPLNSVQANDTQDR
ncbi:glycosyltransferase family 117 protein [Fluviicola taffensis]|uniref:DUF2723 domain-containing protein n=1 Tax=Fluviicola taffensis (strain DSM 16823 / NCIMB 13979 / RW262) TaxID=755732 RepID=F2I9U5_FLUTR|nr:DUF2723 domain-containing protein [Fluviicola taffensis]AEA43091.1 hypothetical protein Fluta_1094 [Fluviicola taffensis DSM 16823]